MPAIAYTKTETTDGAWDGPAAKARLSNTEADLRGAFAWVDAEGDPTTKDAYKGIHHEVAEDGTPGAANLTACSAVIAELNGGRGGFDVPEADRAGVHAHVSHHLVDAGKTAPELKSAAAATSAPRAGRGSPATYPRVSPNGERLERKTAGKVQWRAAEGSPPTIYGHGATFDVLTRIDDWFGSYMEKVARGAFTKTIADGTDVRCLFNHDPNYVLGRTKSGTLALSEDGVGLAYEATPPDTQWARDLGITMARGDVDGSSFGFRIIRDKWSTVLDPDGDGTNDMLDCRTLLECQLFDVSPVTYPAYVESDSAIRSALQGAGFDFEVLGRVLFRRDHGLTLSTHDQAQFRALLDHLRRYLPYLPAEGGASAPPRDAATSAPVRDERSNASSVAGHPPTLQTVTEPSGTHGGAPHLTTKLRDRLARVQRSIAEDRTERLAAVPSR